MDSMGLPVCINSASLSDATPLSAGLGGREPLMEHKEINSVR